MSEILSRSQVLAQLPKKELDLLIIGGGATGCGIALDAATRGLKVGLVEHTDFSSGTSSRSTKLIHGGVRYLEQAALHLDSIQYNLVTDALGERATFFRIAPHLCRRLPILTPLYRRIDIPYFYVGLKLYDWISGKASLGPSHYHSPSRAVQRFPMLKQEGLRGAVVYFDGQFDDARMNVLLATTAAKHGALISNYTEVTALQQEEGQTRVAEVTDRLSGETFTVRAKVIINATGPFTDTIRRMADPEVDPIMALSTGTHILLDKRFCPPATGLLIPRTEDGRLLFLLPWEGGAIAGTTERRCEAEFTPRATEEEVDFILEHLSKYFDERIDRSEVRAAWTGIRPLVGKTSVDSSAKLSRDHLIETSPSGLITITGGKWTTYRKMAQETLDKAIEMGGLSPEHPCATENILLIGAEGFTRQLGAKLRDTYALPYATARHLARAYGSQAEAVLRLDPSHSPLASKHNYLAAEVTYAVRCEMAQTVTDVLARRTRLAFLDVAAAWEALPLCLHLMAQELGWSEERQRQEQEAAEAFLTTMRIG